MASGFERGDQVVIVRGLLAGVEATVLRPARMGFYVIELHSGAPRWAAIRRTRAADWALAPVGRSAPTTAPAAVLAHRARIARIDLLVVLLLVPLLVGLWGAAPALAVVVGAGALAGLLAVHAGSQSRPWRSR